MADPIIEARSMHSYYGPSHVLHGVDLTVNRGETIALMGRNGMGKTTTIRSILGFAEMRQGELLINGGVMTGAEPHLVVRQGIGYVPEGRGIFPTLSVREHFIMAARPASAGRQAWTIDRVLGVFPRLEARLNHLGRHLSGGEQQMVAIGRALMTNPSLVILDEATEGLAPLVRKEIWRVIRTIREAGIASLIVDRDAAALLALADRAVVLANGRVVFSGPAGELAANPGLRQRLLGV
jgi:branched-chain amino acid transport system ATP-binding protein